MKNILRKIKHIFEYIIFSILYNDQRQQKYKILNDIETVNLIINNKMSIARYGDGEFKWLLKIKQNSFQTDNEIMQKRLEQILQIKPKDNILVGIPYMFNDMRELNIDAKAYWKKFFYFNRNNIEKFLNQNQVYCNSNITRPYIDYKDKNYQKIESKFLNLKKIWENREIIIVEGKYSRLGRKNDLFDNVKKIERIICPPVNAFDKYEQIKNTVEQNSKEKLYIISLGPTATIISYDLAVIGYQCVDIGHIDIEYMWFKQGTKHKESIPGKFVNEARTKNNILERDEEYEKQIIKCIE